MRCTLAGDRAKFGLKARMVVAVVEALAENDMLDCFQLLHFHIGSQVGSGPGRSLLEHEGCLQERVS